MPLIVISGFPSSGKSTRAVQLEEYFLKRGRKVHLLSENLAIPKAGFRKNEYFADSQKEKQVRGDMKSEAVRLLNKEDIVILDAGNYIKGYRYELFCATKSLRGTQCTLFCGIQNDLAWQFNCKRTSPDDLAPTGSAEDALRTNSDVPYSRETFDALCMRFEEPQGNCRWDSPLFVVFPEYELDLNGIYAALFEAKALPPNQSTQNPSLSATSYLFELDRLTQQIVSDVLAARKIGILSPVPVKDSEIKVDIPSNVTAIQLSRLRRQFLNYSKLHQTGYSLERAPQLFVQFLNNNCNENMT